MLSMAEEKLQTLTDFIEENQRMIAVIGVLSALGIFWGSSPIAQKTSPTVPFFCMLATLPLYYEIGFRNFDIKKSEWSVVIFVNLFTPLMFGTVWYSVIGFSDARDEQLPYFVCLVFYIAAWQLYKKLKLGAIPILIAFWWKDFIIAKMNKWKPVSEENLENIRDDSEKVVKMVIAPGFQILFIIVYIFVIFAISKVAVLPVGVYLTLKVRDYGSQYIPADTRIGPEKPVAIDP